MKPRTTLILAAILVVLAAVATWFEVQRREARRPDTVEIFPRFSAEAAERIRIEGGQRQEAARQTVTPGGADAGEAAGPAGRAGGTTEDAGGTTESPGASARGADEARELADGSVVLARHDDAWTVETEGGHAADPKLVDQVLEGIDKFEQGTLISRSPDRRSTFQVDTSGVTVRVTGGGDTLASFVVGKAGPDFMSTYIRPLGRDEVYQVPVYMRSLVDRGDQTWRKMTLLDLPKESITGWTTENERESVTVEKAESGAWRITEPVEAATNPDVAGIVANMLSPIRASEFADAELTKEEMGLVPDTARVIIRTEDGKSYRLTVGASNIRNQSYTMLEGDPVVYLVPRGRWNTVFRPLETLRAADEGVADEGLAPEPTIESPGRTVPEPQ